MNTTIRNWLRSLGGPIDYSGRNTIYWVLDSILVSLVLAAIIAFILRQEVLNAVKVAVNDNVKNEALYFEDTINDDPLTMTTTTGYFPKYIEFIDKNRTVRYESGVNQ